MPPKQPTHVPCACGCGQLRTRTSTSGNIRKYIKGHWKKPDPKLPAALCQCGCGEYTKLAPYTCKRAGWTKGHPMKFIRGHTQRGRTHTPEVKKLLSHISKTRGRRPEVTTEHRRKLSEAHIGIQRGNKHPRWKGGVTPERNAFAVMEWARKVRRRDNYTCQKCGHHAKRGMHAHHIWSFAEYPEKRYDVENGVTLCEDCHYRGGVHKTPSSLLDLVFADIA